MVAASVRSHRTAGCARFLSALCFSAAVTAVGPSARSGSGSGSRSEEDSEREERGERSTSLRVRLCVLRARCCPLYDRGAPMGRLRTPLARLSSEAAAQRSTATLTLTLVLASRSDPHHTTPPSLSAMALPPWLMPLLAGLLALLAAYNKYAAAGTIAADWVSSKQTNHAAAPAADESWLAYLSQSPHVLLFSLWSGSLLFRALFVFALLSNARRLFDACKLPRGPSLTHWAGAILAHRGYRSEAQQSGVLMPKLGSRPGSRRGSRAGQVAPTLPRKGSRDEILVNPMVAEAAATLIERTIGTGAVTPRAADGTPKSLTRRISSSGLSPSTSSSNLRAGLGLGLPPRAPSAPVLDAANYNIPENSMLAFIYAHEQGVHGVEVDVCLTKDGIVVVMHDNTLERTMDATGEVPDLTYAQIREARYKPVTAQEYTIRDPRNKLVDIVHVPTLEEVIVFCKTRGLKLMIESKEYTRPLLFRQQVAAFYDKYSMHDWSFVATFNPLHLYWIRRDYPRIPTCLLYCRTCTEWYHIDASKEMLLPSFLNFESVRRVFDWVLWYFSPTLLADFLGVSMVGPHNILISPALITSLTTRGIICDVWVVNSELEKAWLKSLGCIVTSDRLFSHTDLSPFVAGGPAIEAAKPSIHDAAEHISSSYYINSAAAVSAAETTSADGTSSPDSGNDGDSGSPDGVADAAAAASSNGREDETMAAGAAGAGASSSAVQAEAKA